MTRVGVHRARYSAEVEPAPSRFTGGTEYAEWAQRADAWVFPYDGAKPMTAEERERIKTALEGRVSS